MKKNRFVLAIALFASFFLYSLVSCEKENDKTDLQLTDGIIIYAAPPDNCNDYVIVTDNRWFKPSELNSDFEVDSLLIRYAYDSTEHKHPCGFGGVIPIINLTHIEKR